MLYVLTKTSLIKSPMPSVALVIVRIPRPAGCGSVRSTTIRRWSWSTIVATCPGGRGGCPRSRSRICAPSSLPTRPRSRCIRNRSRGRVCSRSWDIQCARSWGTNSCTWSRSIVSSRVSTWRVSPSFVSASPGSWGRGAPCRRLGPRPTIGTTSGISRRS